ncbi:MAG: hypothetical protein RPU40_06480 [Candidatus Sedimenticola sp. (ex Thyasira tokunagai)]
MMKKEFLLGQSNEVIKADKIYDLHNLYDFVGIALNGKDRQLRILFEPSPSYGERSVSVSLVFNEIDYLELSSNFGSRVIQNLDEMGYKNPDDQDDEWLLDEQQSTPNDHLFIRFEGNDFIRVHCQHADIVEAAKLVSV